MSYIYLFPFLGHSAKPEAQAHLDLKPGRLSGPQTWLIFFFMLKMKWSAVPLPCSTFFLGFMGGGRAAAPIGDKVL